MMDTNSRFQLPEEMKTYAEEMLNETEENRGICVRKIKEWAAENPQLHLRTDEKYIVPFLRTCKYDVEKTKDKMKNLYCMKRDRREWFTNRDASIPKLQELIKMGCYLVLKKFDENRLVVIVRATLYDPEIYTIDEVFKIGMMVMDVSIMEEELAQIYGITTIIDLTNVGLGHAKQMSISKIRHMVHVWKNVQYRPQKIYFINAPTYVNVVLNAFKSFMPSKLKERVCIKQDDDLTGLVEQDILPRDFGGCSESIDELAQYWLDKLLSYTAWFVEDEKFVPE